MSEQILKEQVMVEEITHAFYCDDCGKLIKKSSECDDGYYARPDEFTVHGIKINGDYCKECGTKRLNEIRAYLNNALNLHNK